MGTASGTEPTDIRWIQRFENLERALALIKAYEVSFELSWKTLKDLLAWNGVDARLPREVLKQAFAAGLIENGQPWIDRLEARNLLAALDDLPTPDLFDVTHWESLRHQGLRDHIDRVGRLFP